MGEFCHGEAADSTSSYPHPSCDAVRGCKNALLNYESTLFLQSKEIHCLMQIAAMLKKINNKKGDLSAHRAGLGRERQPFVLLRLSFLLDLLVPHLLF